MIFACVDLRKSNCPRSFSDVKIGTVCKASLHCLARERALVFQKPVS